LSRRPMMSDGIVRTARHHKKEHRRDYPRDLGPPSVRANTSEKSERPAALSEKSIESPPSNIAVANTVRQ